MAFGGWPGAVPARLAALAALCVAGTAAAAPGPGSAPTASAGLATGDATARPPPLRWGADAEGGAPYVFRDPTDPTKLVGFELELAALLGRELGRELAFTQYDYVSLMAGLERGDLDLAMNGIEATPDRARSLELSRPYHVYSLELVVRAAAPHCTTLDECLARRARIGTLGDTAAERLLDQRGADKRVYDGQVEPYQDLGLGRLDAVLLDRPIAVHYARRDPKLRLVGAAGPRGHYVIAFRRDRAALRRQVDVALDRLAVSGELRGLLGRWGLDGPEQAELVPPAPPAASAAAALGAAPEAGAPAPGASSAAAAATPPAGTAPDRPPASPGGAAANAWGPRDYLPLLLQGLAVTVGISVLSMALAMLLAFPVALARLGRFPGAGGLAHGDAAGSRVARLLGTAYVEVLRGVPVLLLLFFLYFGLPGLGVELSAWQAAVLGFGLHYAAYEAEVYRAALSAVPATQWEAARVLGLSRGQTLRHVVLPQAARIALPPMTSDFVALFKDTSLVSVIALVELTKQYQILAKSSLRYLELGVVTALLYLAVSLPLGWLSRRLERRWSVGQP